jgi:hypothetical protein
MEDDSQARRPGGPGPGGGGDRTSALVERLFQDAAGALELYTLYIGERLGLYRALAASGPATSSELAERTGTAERYIREWLEHHATGALLDVDDPSASPLERRYELPAEHVPVLADPDDVRYEGHRGVEIVRAARPLPQPLDAFRDGGAPPPLPWEPEGRAEPNRALFLNLLGTEWLPAIPEVDQGSVVVADELVGDEFAAPGPELERYLYGWSVVGCLPDAMGDPLTAATGTVMRPATLRHYALEAGFREVQVLPVSTDFWRFYRLLP